MVDNILKKYPNDVKVVIKNFPLTSHKQAMKAAKYGLAAAKQGKYKEMYHMIFCGTTNSVESTECVAYRKLKTDEDLPLTYARELGLDMNRFIKDFENPEIASQINSEISQLRNLGIRLAVPKFLVQGKEVRGSLDLISAAIDQALKK